MKAAYSHLWLPSPLYIVYMMEGGGLGHETNKQYKCVTVRPARLPPAGMVWTRRTCTHAAGLISHIPMKPMHGYMLMHISHYVRTRLGTKLACIILYIYTVYPEILATSLIWWFGVHDQNCQNSYHQTYISLLTMFFPCCTIVKFKLIFSNILLQPDLVQIAKFNDHQYFRIYICNK